MSRRPLAKEKMNKTLYQWPCKYEGNYDGDTLTLTLDFGFRQYKMVKVRLDGIDTAELRRVKEIPPEEEAVFKAYARLAKEAVAKYFDAYKGEGLFITLTM